MYVIFVVIALLGTTQVVTKAHSKQTFDTLAACEAARQPMVDRSQEALAAQGVTVISSECITTEEDAKREASE